MYLLLPIAGLTALYFILSKRTPTPSDKKEEGKYTPSPSPSDSKPKFKPASAFAADNEEKKPKFKAADSLPIDLWREAILFIFCHRTGFLNNMCLFTRLQSYISVCQPFDIVKKDQKFYPAPAVKVDIEKCKEYEKKLDRKFKPAIYFDNKEADFLINEFSYYLITRYDIKRWRESKSFNNTYKIIYTDNYVLAYDVYRRLYNSSYRITGDTIYTNNKDMIYPRGYFKVFNYKYEKAPKKSKEWYEEVIGELGEFVSALAPDFIEDKIKDLKKKFGIGFNAFVLSGGNIAWGAIAYLTQEAVGKEKATIWLSEIAGLVGGIVIGIFTVGAGFEPARRLTRAQVKFTLTGDPKVCLEIIKSSETDKALMRELQKLAGVEDTSFDFITMTEIIQ